MGLQFARTFTQQALLDAWQEVRDAALADGRPDAEMQQFEADAARRVSHLAVALAEGEWRPLPAHQLEISKPSGGIRRLTIPPLADRVVERALLVTLDREIDPSLLPWSFAYRRGLGTRDALAALTEARDTGATWVARADIRDCFDRIPRWEVMRLVRERVDDERIVHIVGLILDRAVTNRRTAPDNRGRGLHQGSVLAPLLSNLYLDTFDRRMLAAGYRVIRYADDFAIPVESRLEGERALRAAGTELEDLRLELNTGKCHVVSFDDGVRFLGEVDDLRLVLVEGQAPGRQPFRKPRLDVFGPLTGVAEHDQESRPGESHPRPLAEPDLNLSTHPAPIAQPSGRNPKRQ